MKRAMVARYAPGATVFVSLVVPVLLAHGQAPADGVALFASNCAACHGVDGRSGERAPDIVSRRDVVLMTDADLKRIVRSGLPGTGMPAFGFLDDGKVTAIVTTLRALQGVGHQVNVPGDSRRGEGLFFGKAECSSCHMMHGRGGFLAADLSGYGASHPAAEIHAKIVGPDRRLGRAEQLATVVTVHETKWEGFVRSEDNFVVVLQTSDGRYHSFTRQQIEHVEYSGHSTMPRDYGTRLSGTEIDDLISYLITDKEAGNPIAKDDDE